MTVVLRNRFLFGVCRICRFRSTRVHEYFTNSRAGREFLELSRDFIFPKILDSDRIRNGEFKRQFGTPTFQQLFECTLSKVFRGHVTREICSFYAVNKFGCRVFTTTNADKRLPRIGFTYVINGFRGRRSARTCPATQNTRNVRKPVAGTTPGRK